MKQEIIKLQYWDLFDVSKMGFTSIKYNFFISINLPYNMLYTYLLIQIIIFVY